MKTLSCHRCLLRRAESDRYRGGSDCPRCLSRRGLRVPLSEVVRPSLRELERRALGNRIL